MREGNKRNSRNGGESKLRRLSVSDGNKIERLHATNYRAASARSTNGPSTMSRFETSENSTVLLQNEVFKHSLYNAMTIRALGEGVCPFRLIFKT